MILSKMALLGIVDFLKSNLTLTVIGIILLVIGIFLLKARHRRHKQSIFLWVVLAFFIATFILSVIGKNFDLMSFSGIKMATMNYFSWLLNAFENVRTITTNAIRMDWGFK